MHTCPHQTPLTPAHRLAPATAPAHPPGLAPTGTRLAAVLLLACCGLGLGMAAQAQPVGEVSTVFKFLGANHKIVVDAFDDPKVKGVTCYVSRAKTGGISGSLGLAEDKAEASIACRQVGPISFQGPPLRQQEEVFSERISLIFKKLTVVRMVDPVRQTLVYLSYSDRVIEGSPQNSITAVALGPGVVLPPIK